MHIYITIIYVINIYNIYIYITVIHTNKYIYNNYTYIHIFPYTHILHKCTNIYRYNTNIYK